MTGESAESWRRRCDLWARQSPPLAWKRQSAGGGRPCWYVSPLADPRLCERVNTLPAEFGWLIPVIAFLKLKLR